MRHFPIRTLSALSLATALLSACSNPEAEKLEHVRKGDEYVNQKKDEFAVVEYASAVKIDPRFGEARLKLAETYERMKNVQAALPEFIRAADALPDNRALQLKATQLLLISRQFEDAKARADAILAKNPKDVEAMLMRGNAMAALRDSAGAVAEIEEAIKIAPNNSDARVSLAVVQTQNGETKQAEASFREAIKLDPSSPDPKLALANFLLANNRAPEAEVLLKDVLAKEPRNLMANRMLATLYVSSNRVAEAEQPLKTIAEAANTPAARLGLADYYAAAGRTDESVALLRQLAKEPGSANEAELRLAAVDYAQKRVAEAHARLDALLARAPNNASALVLKAQWLTKENKLDEAAERAKAAVSAEPQSASAHFALAVLQERRGQLADAVKSYQEALRLNPRAVAAQLALSRLNLVGGNSAAAQRFAEEARQAQPSNLDARVALVRSLLATGNASRAQTEIASLLKDAPNVAVVHAINGYYLARANDPKGARVAYERALELSPGSLEAIGGLTYLDVGAKDAPSALRRLDAEVAKQPNNAALFTLIAQVHNATGDPAKQEQALRRAVTVDPRYTTGYALLAQLYQQQKRIDEAIAEFEGMVQRDPSNIEAQTMVGILLKQQGKRDEAIKAYEKAIGGQADRAPVAANNLAYTYAEQGTNLDVALQLATSAKQRLPNEAGVDDTLGWVYYKKGMFDQAIRSLEESVKKREDPEVLVHLGLAYAKAAQNAKAREALERAFKLNPRVGGDEARQVLAAVSR